MSTLRYLNADTVRELISVADAVDALRAALVEGTADPENDSPRLFSPAPGGEFLLMPTQGVSFSGVKTLTLAPDNPRRGLPRVQGLYTLFGNDDLAPVALLDATELTLIRTPATTLLAATHLLEARGFHRAGLTVTIIGTGPQSDRHARGVHDLLQPAEIRVIGRVLGRATPLVDRLRADGIPAREGTAEDTRDADVVICVTSSSTPVVNDADISDHAIVLAVGTHGLHAREVPAALARRANVVVEGRASAMREAGNLIPARTVAEWEAVRLPNLQELVRGTVNVAPDRPTLYSGVGMAWEDLVIAVAMHHRSTPTVTKEHP